MKRQAKKISFRSLRLGLRFVIPLTIALTLLAYAVMPLVEKFTLHWFIRDLDNRAQLIAGTLQEPLGEFMEQENKTKLNALLARSLKDERLFALGYCDGKGKMIYRSPTFPHDLGCRLPTTPSSKSRSLFQLPQGLVHISVNTINYSGKPIGSLILIHDMSFVELRSADSRKYIIIMFAVIGLVISFITVLVAHLSWRGWMHGVRALLRGEKLVQPLPPSYSELQPLIGDMRSMMRTMNAERRFADDTTASWTPDTLRNLLRKHLAGDQILVVSNREPYIHVKGEEGIEVQHPASGLVTAVEPVMRACSGTWISHGSGTADREMVDRNDRVMVPPEYPEYTLRRIWLTAEEEEGYYYGFANQGLWPLCHIAHVRPIFRNSDWEYYVTVNQRFADAVVEEANKEDPVVLIQDYHFALLPKLIHTALPKATIITFWHIPWPNPESFGICPWREELLQGMLGSTILGFHTPFHCKNFLETVDRYLETRIEHASSTVSQGGNLTMVETYPISIQWPPPWQTTQLPVEECRDYVRQDLNLSKDCLIGLGVDRLDYTKGILERLRAVKRMLELHPEMIGKFSFIQIAAPSRSALEDYQLFDTQVRSLTAHINNRFSDGSYQPIYLKVEHHEQEEVNYYYRAADVCMVTSLHDGMNLVAKEYVASRDDEQGVLVLSQFTGAANELYEALIVNPYHIEQTADALFRALTMPVLEQQERMHSMRAVVRDFNVYRWAGKMLLDASRVRQREKISTRIGHPL